VILVDANLLIFATSEGPHQKIARAWLDGQINENVRIGLPWASLTGYLRIVTNVRIYGRAAARMDTAWDQVEAWLACPNVWVPTPTERHPHFLRQMLKATGGGGNLVPDAHLAAIAVEHGLLLCSADDDFARFPGLRWMNPLAS
jgi:toxin-antitoxin system PIN domain toxin